MGRAAVLVALAVTALGACGRLHYDSADDAGAMSDTGPLPADSGPPPVDAAGDASMTDGGPDASCIGPLPETCNGIDDDCNGEVDDGNLCPPPSRCADAHCVESRAFGIPLGGAASEVGQAVDVDKHGNIYLAASFDGMITLGMTPLMSHGNGDVLLASFRQDGSFRWAISFGGPDIDSPLGVAVGRDRVVVVGFFQDAVDFGGRVVVAPGALSGYIAAFAPADGALSWVHAFGNGAASFGTDAVATADGFVVSGTFSDSADLGDSIVRSAAGDVEGFVARYAGDGHFQWAHTFPSASESDAWAVAIDPVGGMVFVTGVFSPDVDLGGGPLTTSSGLEAFLGGFALADGGYRWGRTLIGSARRQAHDLVARGDGRLLVAGRFSGDLGTDATPAAARSSGGLDGFVGRVMTGSGEIVDVRGLGGPTDDAAGAIASQAGPSGALYLGGAFTGTATLGTRTADSLGDQDAFISQLDGDFSGVRDLTFGGPGTDAVSGLVVDATGAIVACGSFQGDMVVPTVGMLHSPDVFSSFIARFPMLP